MRALLTSNLTLYLICTLIWGSTWLVITFQLKSASPVTSVFWRFLISWLIMLIWSYFSKANLRFTKKAHVHFAIQGSFMFSINYMLTYVAETQVSSGLVALAFTSLIYFNLSWMTLVYRKPSSRITLGGILIGTIGIGLIFHHELVRFDFNQMAILGILTSVLATLSASAGNWAAFRIHQMKIPVVSGNTWAMLYGTLFTLGWSLISGNDLSADWNLSFVTSLGYLALFGTVIAFAAYLTLSARIGAEKAAYTSIISPVLALILSSFFEDFHWTPVIFTGVLLCLVGNYLTLKPSRTSKE